ncbi:hypothetical protein BCR34DRAFT_586816 [Clohesyomyces aquaticus]|uniref:Uncharacterized protein n=1 Tax=Clohesyomyces aquaticus TaxID=1231657 RepID=A0A1Y1ZSC7_9PLEO|nr:hypothetical protein BCR34DRAFT_586816 [Clohesyomyces aquaticus]
MASEYVVGQPEEHPCAEYGDFMIPLQEAWDLWTDLSKALIYSPAFIYTILSLLIYCVPLFYSYFLSELPYSYLLSELPRSTILVWYFLSPYIIITLPYTIRLRRTNSTQAHQLSRLEAHRSIEISQLRKQQTSLRKGPSYPKARSHFQQQKLQLQAQQAAFAQALAQADEAINTVSDCVRKTADENAQLQAALLEAQKRNLAEVEKHAQLKAALLEAQKQTLSDRKTADENTQLKAALLEAQKRSLAEVEKRIEREAAIRAAHRKAVVLGPQPEFRVQLGEFLNRMTLETTSGIDVVAGGQESVSGSLKSPPGASVLRDLYAENCNRFAPGMKSESESRIESGERNANVVRNRGRDMSAVDVVVAQRHHQLQLQPQVDDIQHHDRNRGDVPNRGKARLVCPGESSSQVPLPDWGHAERMQSFRKAAKTAVESYGSSPWALGERRVQASQPQSNFQASSRGPYVPNGNNSGQISGRRGVLSPQSSGTSSSIDFPGTGPVEARPARARFSIEDSGVAETGSNASRLFTGFSGGPYLPIDGVHPAASGQILRVVNESPPSGNGEGPSGALASVGESPTYSLIMGDNCSVMATRDSRSIAESDLTVMEENLGRLETCKRKLRIALRRGTTSAEEGPYHRLVD